MAQPVDPAGPVELGAWRAEGVGVGEVLAALADLRRGEQRTATRTSVTNLVVVATGAADADRAWRTLHPAGGRHPGRTVVIVARPGAAPGLDAEVGLHGAVAEGRAVWSEDVRLDVGGEAAAHLDSLVEPLTLPDLPVVVWFASGPPSPAEALLAVADAVVVDSGPGHPGTLAAVAALDRRCVVHDLAWAALLPWRQLVAAQFEAADFRPFLAGVEGVAITGTGSAPLLLGGWLASRLGLACAAVEVAPGPGPALRIRARAGGARAGFAVDPAPGGSALEATASVDGRPPRVDRVSLPGDLAAWSLTRALTRTARDRAQGQALRAALVFGS